jgi:hypothetical protein
MPSEIVTPVARRIVRRLRALNSRVDMLVRSVKQEIYNYRLERHVSDSALDARGRLVLADLRLKGIHVIPDYFDRGTCRQIVQDIDDLIVRYRDKIWVDQFEADHRIFGADRLSPRIAPFWANPFVDAVVSAYQGSQARVGFTMANRIVAKEGNLGSGQGWHRDSPAFKQTKAILYLTDVSDANGPFQYLEGTHSPASVAIEQARNGFTLNQNRFTDDEMDRVIARNPDRLRTLTASAGTLIVTDTRGLHRGMPIREGARYALTNYMWFGMPAPQHVLDLVVQP